MASKYKPTEYSFPVFEVTDNGIVQYNTKKVESHIGKPLYLFLVRKGDKLYERSISSTRVTEDLGTAKTKFSAIVESRLTRYRDEINKLEEILIQDDVPVHMFFDGIKQDKI